jgi:uncharacterized protein
MRLRVLPGRFAVCRLAATDPLPSWFSLADGPVAAAVRRGDEELSLVCSSGTPPEDAVAERDWVALEIAVPMEFTLTGVLASVAAPLAEAGVPIFALATYDTDVVLVPGSRSDDALAALRGAGHEVAGT